MLNWPKYPGKHCIIGKWILHQHKIKNNFAHGFECSPKTKFEKLNTELIEILADKKKQGGHVDQEKLRIKWQERWQRDSTFIAYNDSKKPKYYILDMFPYPSGNGLHVGHALGYIGTDIIARYYRMRGYNVLHPMGWDAFGLPAEQYAIKTGTSPSLTTKRNCENFRKQLQLMGLSYYWSR